MVPRSPPPAVAIGSSSSHLNVSCFIHTPCYCEENVYFLCKKLIELGFADPQGLDLFVVLISNDDRQVPLWWQKASKEADGLVLWDYHVICVQLKKNGDGQHHYLVWDLDSRLPFPSSLKQYLAEAMRPSVPLHAKFRRVLQNLLRLKRMRSKSHYLISKDYSELSMPQSSSIFLHLIEVMRNSNGNWIAPPPSYNPIVSQDGIMNNLNEYIQLGISDVMEDLEDSTGLALSNKLGVVVTQTQLDDLFALLEDRL